MNSLQEIPAGTSLESLESSLVAHILLYLDPFSVLKVNLTCKTLHKSILERRIFDIVLLRSRLGAKGIFIPDAIIFQILKLKKFNLVESLELLEDYWVCYGYYLQSDTLQRCKRSELSKFQDPNAVIKEQLSYRKAMWVGRDRSGRPCILIRPAYHKIEKNSGTLLLAMYLFEQACTLVQKANSSDFCVILDFEGFGTRNFDVSFAKTFVIWARKFYKNLLGTCHVIRSPAYALLCWNIIRLLVPAATLQKIIIHKKDEWKSALSETFDVQKLPMDYGGKVLLEKMPKIIGDTY